MIEVNLLPENLRKNEGTPLPRQLTIYLGVAVCMSLIFLNWFYFKEIEKAENKLKKINTSIVDEKIKVNELDALIQKITIIKSHVTTVENLYRNRIIWAKVLFDLKHVINKQGYNKPNAKREYIWFTELSLSEKSVRSRGLGMPAQKVKSIKLKGIASAIGSGGSRRATAMVTSLINTMVNYKPEKSPEDEAIEEIEKTLKLRQEIEEKLKGNGKKKKEQLSEHEERKLRAENELIKHLQDKKSGGIALMPFMKQFNEKRDLKLSWNDKVSAGGGEKRKLMPEQAMKFELDLTFKPQKKKVLQPGF